MSDDAFTTAAIVRNWQELVEIEDKYSDPKEEWIFRGDSCVRRLQPTLERITAGTSVNRGKLEKPADSRFSTLISHARAKRRTACGGR